EGGTPLLRAPRRPLGPAALLRRRRLQVRAQSRRRGGRRPLRDRQDLRARRPRMPERPGVTTRLVTLAVPCRTDEPALGRTLAEAWASWEARSAAAPPVRLARGSRH